MKIPSVIIALAIFVTSVHGQQESKVLVDIFTNSHCSPCASMHAAVKSSITNTAINTRAIVVYNHLSTYQDDPIYQANRMQPAQRAAFLGGVSGTPTTFFNGTRQSSSYSQWPGILQGLLATESGYSITPLLTYTADSLILTYTISRTMSDPNATIYGVLVENVTYKGRNGVSEHDGALRFLFTPVAGDPLSFDANGVAMGRLAIARQSIWDVSKLRAVISVQDPATKKSLQAEQVSAQMATSVESDEDDRASAARVEVVSVAGVTLLSREGVYSDNNSIVAEMTGSLQSGAYFVRIIRPTSITVRPVAIIR